MVLVVMGGAAGVGGWGEWRGAGVGWAGAGGDLSFGAIWAWHPLGILVASTWHPCLFGGIRTSLPKIDVGKPTYGLASYCPE